MIFIMILNLADPHALWLHHRYYTRMAAPRESVVGQIKLIVCYSCLVYIDYTYSVTIGFFMHCIDCADDL